MVFLHLLNVYFSCSLGFQYQHQNYQGNGVIYAQWWFLRGDSRHCGLLNPVMFTTQCAGSGSQLSQVFIWDSLCYLELCNNLPTTNWSNELQDVFRTIKSIWSVSKWNITLINTKLGYFKLLSSNLCQTFTLSTVYFWSISLCTVRSQNEMIFTIAVHL